MEHTERINEVVESSNKKTERIFPILNKIDRIWSANPEMQFCELVKLVVIDGINDLEFTKKLDAYIDEHDIK